MNVIFFELKKLKIHMFNFLQATKAKKTQMIFFATLKKLKKNTNVIFCNLEKAFSSLQKSMHVVLAL